MNRTIDERWRRGDGPWFGKMTSGVDVVYERSLENIERIAELELIRDEKSDLL